MGRKSFIAIVAAVTALLTGAVGVYAWDSGREDLIADGVRVAGIDLGGLRAAEAREVLEADLVEPLSRPITVRFGEARHELTRERLKIESDVEAMVSDAVAATREGGLPARAMRALTGGTLERDLPPQISYSEKELDRFVTELAKKIDRPARDASVKPSPSSLSPVPSREGRSLRTDQLRSRIATELESQAGSRTVRATVRKVKPKVTTSQLAKRHPHYILVDRNSFTLRHFVSLKPAKSYRIAVGAAGYDTPTGLYSIQNKQVNPTWHVPERPWAGKLAGRVIPPGPQNPLKARWMGIYNGAGIHGTDAIGSLGSRASHGCIRMAVPDVINLFEKVPVGTPVYIA